MMSSGAEMQVGLVVFNSVLPVADSGRHKSAATRPKDPGTGRGFGSNLECPLVVANWITQRHVGGLVMTPWPGACTTSERSS